MSLHNGPNIPINEPLLVKYLAGEASPDEAMAIDDWLQLPENRQTFERLSGVWTAAGEGSPWQPPDVDREWHVQTARRPVKRRIPLLLYAAAAMVAVFFGAGLVYWMQRTPAAVVYTTASTEQVKVLPDSSAMTLGPHAEAAYRAADGKRILSLKGSGYFEVKADPGHPFAVEAGQLRIEVIGTRFRVAQEKDSITVTVDEGAVRVVSPDDSLVVRTGMQAVYVASQRRLELLPVAVVRSLTFHNASLLEVATTLEASYGIKVVLTDVRIGDCQLSTSFTDKPVAYVAEVIAASLGLQYRLEGGTLYFDGDACL
ncbi:FecR family protein [Chitinophaga lutea]